MSEDPESLDEGFSEPLDIDELDANFKFEVAKYPGGDTVLSCFQCANCTIICPVSSATRILPHQIIRMTVLGMKEEVLKSNAIWLCSTCFECNEVCPQGVRVCDVIFALKNMASAEVAVPINLKIVGQNIYKFGRIQEIGEFESSEREFSGLPPLPSVDTDTIREIMRRSKFDKLVEVEGQQ
ncbi:MAG: 4Fe-4S dicluster domain-containing protein [Candidatus Bathyarchaeia archaeon]